MPTYDHPFYKQLRKNDLGIENNQGGPYIPKELLPFFPPLPLPHDRPTEEYVITLDLFDGITPIATVLSRWHFQTWGGRRPPEYRITQNIHSALLSSAAEDDILRFERQHDSVDRFRVTLLRSGSTDHTKILQSTNRRRWGVIDQLPLSLTAIEDEAKEIESAQEQSFKLVSHILADPQRRLFRDAAFARLVKRAYDHMCAACGSGFIVPVGEPGPDPLSEPEAAHIIPVALKGPDDLRNGLCLCRAHHWAFDRNMIFVDESGVWRVSTLSKRENRNVTLNDIDGISLTPPHHGYPAPAQEALSWHRSRVLT